MPICKEEIVIIVVICLMVATLLHGILMICLVHRARKGLNLKADWSTPKVHKRHIGRYRISRRIREGAKKELHNFSQDIRDSPLPIV